MKKTRRSYNSTLPASKGPTRKTRLRVKGKSRFPKQRQPEYTAWVRTRPCVVAALECKSLDEWQRDHCFGSIEAAHIGRTRAVGTPDIGHVAPLCEHHHGEQEGRTKTFEKKYGLNLKAIANDLGRRWRELHGETAA